MQLMCDNVYSMPVVGVLYLCLSSFLFPLFFPFLDFLSLYVCKHIQTLLTHINVLCAPTARTNLLETARRAGLGGFKQTSET